MFTAVIPMMLVMRQADTLHEMRKHELGILDQERAMESLCLYVCPDGPSSKNVEVTIVNNCEVLIRVVSLWINNETVIMEIDIPSLSEEVLVPLALDPVNGDEYDIRVTTDRGNVYTSENGILYYQEDAWVTETLGIRIILPSRPGKGARTNLWLNELRVTIADEEGDILYSNYTMYWAISASENFFELESAGDYKVTIYIWCQKKISEGYPNQHWEMIYGPNEIHSITWPTDDPIIEIKFAIDGDHLIVPG